MLSRRIALECQPVKPDQYNKSGYRIEVLVMFKG